MSSQIEEGDYVDMSGLVFIDFSSHFALSKDISLPLDGDAIHVIYIYIFFFSLSYCIQGWTKHSSFCIFRMAGHKEESAQPSTSGIIQEK